MSPLSALKARHRQKERMSILQSATQRKITRETSTAAVEAEEEKQEEEEEQYDAPSFMMNYYTAPKTDL